MDWELLQHLPYSPALAPSNFRLFGPQSESLEHIKFKNDEYVLQHFVQKLLQMPLKKLNATGFIRLVEQWENYSELQGKYVKK